VTRALRTALAVLAGAASAHADALPDARVFCEVTPCLQGTAHRRVLAKDETVGGARCKHGTEVGTDDAGHVMNCTLAGAQTLDALPAAADAYTLFHPNGRVYQTHLATPHEFAMPDGSTTSCDAEVVAVYDDGSLYWCELHAARGVARVHAAIMFYPGGKPMGLTLDAAGTLGALQVPAGTAVQWDASGTALGGELPSPITARGLSIRGEFTLLPSGQVGSVVLAAETTLAHTKFPAGAELQLRDDGSLERAKWISARGFMIHGEEWEDTTTASYDATGHTTSSYTTHYQSNVRPEKYKP
jgi:hypothetical protein